MCFSLFVERMKKKARLEGKVFISRYEAACTPGLVATSTANRRSRSRIRATAKGRKVSSPIPGLEKDMLNLSSHRLELLIQKQQRIVEAQEQKYLSDRPTVQPEVSGDPLLGVKSDVSKKVSRRRSDSARTSIVYDKGNKALSHTHSRVSQHSLSKGDHSQSKSVIIVVDEEENTIKNTSVVPSKARREQKSCYRCEYNSHFVWESGGQGFFPQIQGIFTYY